MKQNKEMPKSWARDIRTVLQEISGRLLLAIKRIIWTAVYTMPVVLILSGIILACNIFYKKHFSIIYLNKIYQIKETQGSEQEEVALKDLKFASKMGVCKQKLEQKYGTKIMVLYTGTRALKDYTSEMSECIKDSEILHLLK